MASLGWLGDWWPLFLVSGFAAFAVYEYRSTFTGPTSSTHSQWGEFGDFLGGVLNPFIGLVTILLVIRGLRVQMREFTKSVEHLESSAQAASSQVIEMRNSTRREWLLDRVEKVMAEIESELNQERYLVYGLRTIEAAPGRSTGARLETLDSNVSVEYVFNRHWEAGERLIPRNDLRSERLQARVGEVQRVSAELAYYLGLIDEQLADKDSAITDYFRRRVYPQLEPVVNAGYFSLAVAAELKPKTVFV